MRQLTVAELLKHELYETAVWDLHPESQGRLAVAHGRGGPFNIAFEVHGRGPRRVVWIMGLGAMRTAWQRQTKDFGHMQCDEYSCLVLDNRGIGRSDAPLLRYSTSEMARDVIEVLDHVGWSGRRQLHVVGASMGGMIGQELALLIPDRIASLTLLSTAARLMNTVGFIEGWRSRIDLLIPKDLDQQIALTKGNLFTDAWVAQPDEEGGAWTNGDRYAAQELHKRLDPEGLTRTGFLCQIQACYFHHKSAKQLRDLGDQVGRQRIQVIHGTADKMITFPHMDVLLDGLGGEARGVTKYVFEDKGHGLPMEERRKLAELVGALIDKTTLMVP